MDWKLLSVVFFCSFCAVGSGAMAADGVQTPDAAGIREPDGLPMAMIMPAEQAPGALALSSLVADLSPESSFALSVSERLQLREQIRKAAQDIYAERPESLVQGDVLHVQNGGVRISP